MCLEGQLLEEVLLGSHSLGVLGLSLLGVSVGEVLLQASLGSDSTFRSQSSRVDQLLHVELNLVSGGHDVVQVDGLHEGLDDGSSGDLLLTHGSSDRSRVSSDASHDGVRESVFVRTFLESYAGKGRYRVKRKGVYRERESIGREGRGGRKRLGG